MTEPTNVPIRPDVEKILRGAFPQGVMAPALDIQKSHLADIFPRLKARLLELDGAAVGYERDPLGGAGWSAGDGRLPSGAGEGDHDEPPSSYYLFFLAATAEPCRVGPGDTLQVGYSVALSVMAPAALIVLNHMENDEDDFSYSVPDIWAEAVDVDGGPMDIGDFCREVLPTEGPATLEQLRAAIIATLGAFGITVLPEEEQAKPIPWLQVPAMPFANPMHLSVRDALFFQAMAG